MNLTCAATIFVLVPKSKSVRVHSHKELLPYLKKNLLNSIKYIKGRFGLFCVLSSSMTGCSTTNFLPYISASYHNVRHKTDKQAVSKKIDHDLSGVGLQRWQFSHYSLLVIRIHAQLSSVRTHLIDSNQDFYCINFSAR